MADGYAITLRNVSKDFRLPHEKVTSIKSAFVNPLQVKKGLHNETHHALKDVTFDVKHGEFFGIVGRNGSGKSTLLKIIANIYQPSDGEVSVRGKLVPFIELGVGFNPELSGRDNVYLNGALMGFSRKEIDEMYEDIVSFSELEQFMDQKLKNYSSGMQVRLAFSMATRSKADILLVDEVLAVGDTDFQRKCFNYFKELKRAQKTVVFVSHDMSAVREYCDRVALIEKSECVAIGDAKDIAADYEKLFLREVLNSATRVSTDLYRWGEGQIKTSNVIVDVKQKEIVIRHSIIANTTCDEPIPGFRVRDASGKDVLGTNSKIENMRVGTLEPNNEITLEWRFSNILADGEYVVDPAILLENGTTVADWWDEAARFTINKNRRLPYVVDPGFTTTIKRG